MIARDLRTILESHFAEEIRKNGESSGDCYGEDAVVSRNCKEMV